MSAPSQWPLTFDAVRHITPAFMVKHLRQNPLTRACYPTAMGYYPLADGHQINRKSHDDNILIYCVEGSGKLETDDFEGGITQGDIILLPAGHDHVYAADKRTPWSLYWLHFDGIQTSQLLEELDYNPSHPVVNLGLKPLLVSDFKRLLSLRKSGYQRNIFNYAAAIVRQMLHYLALETHNLQTLQRHNFNLDSLHSLMHENLNGELDLDTLAASANLSRHHFSAKYKKITGTSPIKHFIHLKIEHACYLLDTSENTIKQVSAKLGYEDPLYFSRQFRKVLGLSPSEYRKRQRG